MKRFLRIFFTLAVFGGLGAYLYFYQAAEWLEKTGELLLTLAPFVCAILTLLRLFVDIIAKRQDYVGIKIFSVLMVLLGYGLIWFTGTDYVSLEVLHLASKLLGNVFFYGFAVIMVGTWCVQDFGPAPKKAPKKEKAVA